MRRLWLAAAGVTAVLTVTACGAHDDERGKGDAPVATAASGKRGGDDSAAFCTNMPDGFGNVCGKCVDHFAPWAVVVTTSTSYAPSSMALFKAKQCGATDTEAADQPPVVFGTSGDGIAPEDDS
jgi:hypothetical protein